MSSLLRLLLFAALLPLGARGGDVGVPGAEDRDPAVDVSERLEAIRSDCGVPALVALAYRDGKVVASGACGVRSVETGEAVQGSDPFHLGSCAKAMTATVAAVLIEQGDLDWDSTVEDAFPDLVDDLHAGYLGVTLEQLLSHRGGIAERTNPAVGGLIAQLADLEGTPREQRRQFVRTVMSRKPTRQPGASTEYSNYGFMIAAAMLEDFTDRDYEDLIVEELFEPLGMKSALVGSPAGEGCPVGHQRENGETTALLPGPGGTLPASMAPAGLVSCSLSDWAIFVADHLAGERGKDGLLSASSYQRLHAPPQGASYAGGWGIGQADWAKGKTLGHNGSDGTWYAVVQAAPSIDLTLLAVVNTGPGEEDPCAQAIQVLREALQRP